MTGQELLRRSFDSFIVSRRPEQQIEQQVLSMLLDLMVAQINDQERRLQELEKPRV